MITTAQKIAAEVRVRELLEREDLPPADVIEYGETWVRFLWEETKVALVIDVDEVLGAEPDELRDLHPFPPQS
jgi:hypothetical protein